MADRDISITTAGFRTTIDDPSGAAQRGLAAVVGPADDAITAGLAAAEFQVVRSMGVAPDESYRRGLAPPSLTIDVPLAPGEGAALLVEDESGRLQWQLPATAVPGEAVWRGDVAPAVATFVVGGEEASAPDGRRGILGEWIIDKVTQPVRVHVLRFLARRSIDAAVNHIEGGMATGPVLVTGADPLAWPVGDLAAAKARIAGRQSVRLLLLVHGTFSSTAGSFAGMAGHALLDGYDVVLGYDHRTLADEPMANAEGILAALHALDLPDGSSIDAIAFSRGGLVLRLLIERLLPASPLRAPIDKAVFVGCTNAGTLLAEPDNWRVLLDLYTNILVAGARIGTALTGTATVQPFVTTAIRLMGGFAQMLSQVAITERYVPGLAAMEPDGRLVQELNGASATAGAARYHTIANDFEPSGDHAGLALLAIDRVADRLYDKPNDLVVHTGSMDDFGTAATAEEKVTLTTPGVFHTIYFLQSEVLDQIAAWLASAPTAKAFAPEAAPAAAPSGGFEPDTPEVRRGKASINWGERQVDRASPFGGGAGLGTERLGAQAFDYEEAGDTEHRGGWDDDGAGDTERRGGWDDGDDGGVAAAPPLPEPAALDFAPPDAELVTAPAPASAPVAAPPPPAPATAERYIAAEMTPFPTLDKPVSVYVTVSPDAIVVADHAAAATTPAPVTVASDRPLTIEVIPLSNCEVVGAPQQEVDPADPDELIRKFLIRGLAGGSAELRIEVRQGIQPIANFTLKPVFVEARPAPLSARAEAPPPPAIDRKGRVVLRVYEFKTGDNSLRLQFNLTSDDPEFADLQLLSVDGGAPLDRYAPAVLQQVEKAYKLRKGDGREALYKSFIERLTSDAIERTNALIPEPIRRMLWKFRAQITSIQVISSEPFIPWELMYLSDPDGEDDDGQGFLAEWGLTRWLHDAPINRHRLRTDQGSCHYVIPEYTDARTVLKGAAAEKKALKDRFGDAITEIPATSSDVREFLRTGATNCALLHFACHGRVKQEDVIASELLMLSQTNAAQESVPDTLTWQDVSACTDFGKGGGPLVFINACQTGQQGSGIVGPAGFARAFLRPQSRRGAAAFIGALWSVDDTLANEFARSVYANLDKGQTLGEAVKAAREVCKTNNDFTWLAYTVFAG